MMLIAHAKRLGLIDNKTCSIDEERSGIRFVVPQALRRGDGKTSAWLTARSGELTSRQLVVTAKIVISTALATHHWQIASISNSSAQVRYRLKPKPTSSNTARRAFRSPRDPQ